MSTDSCVIRNYCSADVDRYIRFHARAESVCRSEDTFLLASLRGESLQPVEFSEEDLFMAEEKGEIVGSCRVVPEPAIDRAVLRLMIAPGFFGRAAEAELLRSALRRAADLKTTKVHADLREEDSAARDLFARLGFTPVRRYTDMALDLEPASIGELKYEGLSKRSLEPGGEAEFARLQNDAFAGSWGFCPNTTAEIVQQLNTPGYGHDGVIVAYYKETAVGYCWTAEVHRQNRESETKTGRIHMMGVAPESRGRGFGKYILWTGLKHLAGNGIRTVELTVDNENEAARSLYESTGFKRKTALVWYEKHMR